jgi:signal transduction histidine kinase
VRVRWPGGSAGTGHRHGLPRVWTDVGPAALLGAAAVTELLSGVSGARDPGQPAVTPAQVLLALAVTLPFAARTAAPVAVGLGVQAVLTLATLVLVPAEVFLVAIAVFVLGPYTAAVGARTWRGSLACGLASALLLATQGALDDRYGTGAALANATYALLVWGVAALVRRYREAADAARQLADAAHRLADARAELAVEAERRRVARDLHDVVAHGLSVVVLRARGAVHDLDADPASAGAALRDIDAVASRALQDMRRLLAVTTSGAGLPLAPQPTLADLPELVGDVRATGLDVRLTTAGTARTLTPGAELVAYRVVQESLTNVVRHAAARHTEVRLEWAADALVIEVADDGCGGTAGAGGGRGLDGMQERVGLVGGRVHCGPGADGGFRVRAEVPVAA